MDECYDIDTFVDSGHEHDYKLRLEPDGEDQYSSDEERCLMTTRNVPLVERSGFGRKTKIRETQHSSDLLKPPMTTKE